MGGAPDTAPWGLALRAGRGEQANSPELNNEAALKTALGNREQGRRGCSHEHLAKPSIRAMHLPWARKPQSYQVTTVPGSNLLMQSAGQLHCRRTARQQFLAVAKKKRPRINKIRKAIKQQLGHLE